MAADAEEDDEEEEDDAGRLMTVEGVAGLPAEAPEVRLLLLVVVVFSGDL